jgi:hypothetical protein
VLAPLAVRFASDNLAKHAALVAKARQVVEPLSSKGAALGKKRWSFAGIVRYLAAGTLFA